MNLQDESLYDTCCLSQNIPTSSSSLIVSCDVFEIFLVEVHSYTISENWSHRLYMLLSKHPFGISYDFIADIMSYLFLFTSCVCMFLYGSSCPLYKLIYTRALIYHLDILILCRPSFLSFQDLIVLVRRFMSAWLYSILSSCTHIS